VGDEVGSIHGTPFCALSIVQVTHHTGFSLYTFSHSRVPPPMSKKHPVLSAATVNAAAHVQ
jgi:hypothetical protein